MAETGPDPRFPDRPTHVDFARLVGVVQALDAQSDAGREFDEVAGAFVDVESVTYMAVQRARRLAVVTGLPEEALAAIWLDGFAAGVGFEKASVAAGDG